MAQGRVRHMLLKSMAAMLLLLGAETVATLHAGERASSGESDKSESKDSVPASIVQQFVNLSDDNPARREEARRKLMYLSRKDLPALQAVVKRRSPLSAADAEVLRDIVTQVYLAESYYANTADKGFLGVTFYTPAFDDDPGYDLECGGVEIAQRLPGTCSFRSLEDGDVILEVGEGPHRVKVIRWTDMTREIQNSRPGQTVVLTLFRRGRVVSVPIVLDAKPVGLDVSWAIDDFIARRRAEADAYWEESFEPLLEDHELR